MRHVRRWIFQLLRKQNEQETRAYWSRLARGLPVAEKRGALLVVAWDVSFGSEIGRAFAHAASID